MPTGKCGKVCKKHAPIASGAQSMRARLHSVDTWGGGVPLLEAIPSLPSDVSVPGIEQPGVCPPWRWPRGQPTLLGSETRIADPSAVEGLACISLSSSRLAVTLVSLLPSLSLAMSRCGSPESTCVWQSHVPVCGDSWVLHSAGHCPIPIARGTARLCVCVIHWESGAGLVVGTHRTRSERHFWNDACVTRASTVRLCLPQRLCHLRGSVQPWGM